MPGQAQQQPLARAQQVRQLRVAAQQATLLQFGVEVGDLGWYTAWGAYRYALVMMRICQAEAIADLIDASTEAAARSAGRSLSGAFSQEIHGLRDALDPRKTFR